MSRSRAISGVNASPSPFSSAWVAHWQVLGDHREELDDLALDVLKRVLEFLPLLTHATKGTAGRSTSRGGKG